MSVSVRASVGKGADGAQKGSDDAQKGTDSAEKGSDGAQKSTDDAQKGTDSARKVPTVPERYRQCRKRQRGAQSARANPPRGLACVEAGPI